MGDGSSKKTLKIVLAIIGGSVLLVVLACGGLAYWATGMMADLQKAQAGADAFLDKIATGKVDEAYLSTSTAFQDHATPEGFRETIQRYPALARPTRRSLAGMRIVVKGQGPQAVFQYNLANDNNTLSLGMILVRQGDRWAVESLNLP